MNAGLSNLATLKAHLLTDALTASTDYDTRIAAVGQHVAGAMEQFTGRRFGRLAGERMSLPGDRLVFVLPRLPIEAVTAIEWREKLSDPWTDALAALDYYDDRSGVVHLASSIASRRAQLRITWTGGYWWEQLEPTEGGYPTALPEGATALPAELRGAWLLQCEHVWRTMDKLGTVITEGAKETSGLLPDLLPIVQRQLAAWRVYSL